MPSANNIHSGFDYSGLSPKSHHRAWRALVFIVFGSIAGASGLALQWHSEEMDAERAAVSLSRSVMGSRIVSLASAAAPDSRQDSAPAPQPVQAAAVDPEPTKTAVVSIEPAATASEPTQPAITTAPEPPPPQPAAAPVKPKKTGSSKKVQKTARQNQRYRHWYDAYAWGQQSGDYWRARSYNHTYGRRYW